MNILYMMSLHFFNYFRILSDLAVLGFFFSASLLELFILLFLSSPYLACPFFLLSSSQPACDPFFWFSFFYKKKNISFFFTTISILSLDSISQSHTRRASKDCSSLDVSRNSKKIWKKDANTHYRPSVVIGIMRRNCLIFLSYTVHVLSSILIIFEYVMHTLWRLIAGLFLFLFSFFSPLISFYMYIFL